MTISSCSTIHDHVRTTLLFPFLFLFFSLEFSNHSRLLSFFIPFSLVLSFSLFLRRERVASFAPLHPTSRDCPRGDAYWATSLARFVLFGFLLRSHPKLRIIVRFFFRESLKIFCIFSYVYIYRINRSSKFINIRFRIFLFYD